MKVRQIHTGREYECPLTPQRLADIQRREREEGVARFIQVREKLNPRAVRFKASCLEVAEE